MSHEEDILKTAEQVKDSLDTLAKGILQIAEAIKVISETPMRRETVLKLIQLNTRPQLSLRDIEAVIESMETLGIKFLKK